jgi:hypothetical protein
VKEQNKSLAGSIPVFTLSKGAFIMNIPSDAMTPSNVEPIRNPEIPPNDKPPGNDGAKAGAPDPIQPSRPPADDDPRPDKVPLDGAGLLQQTTLAPGENPEDLIRLIDDVEEALKPKDFFERFEATDLVNAAWEERRYSQQRLALTAAMRFKAFVCLVNPLAEAFGGDAIAIAGAYFDENPDRRADVSIYLAQYGITDAAINALAADLQTPAMTLLDRRIASARSIRNGIVKDFQRRARKAVKGSAQKPLSDDGESGGESRGRPH